MLVFLLTVVVAMFCGWVMAAMLVRAVDASEKYHFKYVEDTYCFGAAVQGALPIACALAVARNFPDGFVVTGMACLFNCLGTFVCTYMVALFMTCICNTSEWTSAAAWKLQGFYLLPNDFWNWMMSLTAPVPTDSTSTDSDEESA